MKADEAGESGEAEEVENAENEDHTNSIEWVWVEYGKNFRNRNLTSTYAKLNNKIWLSGFPPHNICPLSTAVLPYSLWYIYYCRLRNISDCGISDDRGDSLFMT